MRHDLLTVISPAVGIITAIRPRPRMSPMAARPPLRQASPHRGCRRLGRALDSDGAAAALPAIVSSSRRLTPNRSLLSLRPSRSGKRESVVALGALREARGDRGALVRKEHGRVHLFRLNFFGMAGERESEGTIRAFEWWCHDRVATVYIRETFRASSVSLTCEKKHYSPRVMSPGLLQYVIVHLFLDLLIFSFSFFTCELCTKICYPGTLYVSPYISPVPRPTPQPTLVYCVPGTRRVRTRGVAPSA